MLTVVYLVVALIGRPWFAPGAPHALKAVADLAVQGVRLVDVVLYLWIIGWGVVRSAKPSRWLAAIAAVLVGVGLFATELSRIGMPGIWFPYGTGVARGQYAYAAFIVILCVLISMRSVEYARRKHDGGHYFS